MGLFILVRPCFLLWSSPEPTADALNTQTLSALTWPLLFMYYSSCFVTWANPQYLLPAVILIVPSTEKVSSSKALVIRLLIRVSESPAQKDLCSQTSKVAPGHRVDDQWSHQVLLCSHIEDFQIYLLYPEANPFLANSRFLQRMW